MGHTGTRDLGAFGETEGINEIDADVGSDALAFCMAEKDLNCAAITERALPSVWRLRDSTTPTPQPQAGR